MGVPLNTSILMTCRVAGCGLIWLIEPPQGGQPSFLRGRNKILGFAMIGLACIPTPAVNMVAGGALNDLLAGSKDTIGGPAHRPAERVPRLTSPALIES
jgi:hypothetical protein